MGGMSTLLHCALTNDNTGVCYLDVTREWYTKLIVAKKKIPQPTKITAVAAASKKATGLKKGIQKSKAKKSGDKTMRSLMKSVKS